MLFVWAGNQKQAHPLRKSRLSCAKHPIRNLFINLALTICIFTLHTSGLMAASLIEKIEIIGNERIETDTIRTYLPIELGQELKPELSNRALKELFATGLFADVLIKQVQGTLVIEVIENPIINRVAFEGNERIDDETLNSEVQLRPRVVYTRTRVQTDAQRILEIYRRSGRFGAKVEPKVIQLTQNRVDLIFEIREGDSTGIHKINFIGNKRFSDRALRDEIITSESAWYRFFSSDDTYDPDRLAFDQELLRKYYLKNGYADFRVKSTIAELGPKRKNFLITFSIDEGKRYRFGKITIDSRLTDLNAENLTTLITTTPGEWYNADKVEDTIQSLTDSAGNLGYAFVDIKPIVSRNREDMDIEITYQIDEGPRVYVQRIDITGNTRTLDRVLRREFQIVEGDAFNSAKIKRSKQQLQNLGFFEKVDIATSTGDEKDKSIITVSVQEKSTGELSFGAGLSSQDGVLGDIGIVERNLLGRGQSLRLNTTISVRTQELDLSFTEPYFLGKNLLTGIDLFRKTSDQQDVSSFDMKSLGFNTRIGYVISDNFRHTVRYTLRRDVISDVSNTASRFIRDQEGKTTTSAIGHTLSYDLRDSRLDPSSGYIIRFGQELAGIGGSVKHLRNTFDYSYHYPLGNGLVATAQLKNGHIVGIGQDIRVNNRFLLGGQSLRGFEPGGVGPRDLLTDDALGGNFFYSGTADLSFPINISKDFPISGSVFSDVGALTSVDETGVNIGDSGEPRLSLGIGFSYRSPLGPIRIDFAEAIIKKDFDETEGFRFSFGTRF